MNPLYQQMQAKQSNNIVDRFNRFKQNFKGNPREQIQSMLNSGKITQAQYDEAVRKANQIKSLLGM